MIADGVCRKGGSGIERRALGRRIKADRGMEGRGGIERRAIGQTD